MTLPARPEFLTGKILSQESILTKEIESTSESKLVQKKIVTLSKKQGYFLQLLPMTVAGLGYGYSYEHIAAFQINETSYSNFLLLLAIVIPFSAQMITLPLYYLFEGQLNSLTKKKFFSYLTKIKGVQFFITAFMSILSFKILGGKVALATKFFCSLNLHLLFAQTGIYCFLNHQIGRWITLWLSYGLALIVWPTLWWAAPLLASLLGITYILFENEDVEEDHHNIEFNSSMMIAGPTLSLTGWADKLVGAYLLGPKILPIFFFFLIPYVLYTNYLYLYVHPGFRSLMNRLRLYARTEKISSYIRLGRKSSVMAQKILLSSALWSFLGVMIFLAIFPILYGPLNAKVVLMSFSIVPMSLLITIVNISTAIGDRLNLILILFGHLLLAIILLVWGEAFTFFHIAFLIFLCLTSALRVLNMASRPYRAYLK